MKKSAPAAKLNRSPLRKEPVAATREYGGPTAVYSVPLASLRPWAKNPRAELGSLEELAQSIRLQGVLQPLIVRRATNGAETQGAFVEYVKGTTLEIVCGHRRAAAARLAGVESVPCLIRDDVPDEVAMGWALIENLQRATLSPIEQAWAYSHLQTSFHYEPSKIGELVGESAAHVERRLLLCRLGAPALALLAAGWLAVAAAEELARIHSHEEQAEILGSGTLGDYRTAAAIAAAVGGKPVPPCTDSDGLIPRSDVRDEIERSRRDLSRAPFDVGPDLLPAAGACGLCPKRTGAQGRLFGFDEKDPDVCLDADCWGKKLAIHVEDALERAKAKGVRVLRKAEAAEALATTLRHDSKLVDLDAPTDVPGKRGSWRGVARKVLDEVEEVVAIDSDGVPRSLAPRRELLRAMRDAGLVKPEPPKGPPAKTAEELAAEERARRLRARVRAEVLPPGALGALDKPVAGAGTRSAGVFAFLLRALWARAPHETRSALAKARNLSGPAGISDVEAELLAILEEKNRAGEFSNLVRSCLEIAAELPDLHFGWTTRDEKGHRLEGAAENDRGIGLGLEYAARDMGVDVPKLAKAVDMELARERAARAKAAKQPAAEPTRDGLPIVDTGSASKGARRAKPAKPAKRTKARKA